jgi:cell wall-associated NlpC family hydrolase
MILDDGYQSWIDQDAVIVKAELRGAWKPRLLTAAEIERRIPNVLAWSERVEQQPNSYLWGGTTEPDMDCSGLMQMAFASQNIWIPRDAYQQEQFCQPIAVTPGACHLLRPGDLIFFGSRQRCTHVGLHLGNGRYRHSSGIEHGRNGIGIDSLQPQDNHPVACHYRAELRGAGRVVRCHDGQAWV